MDDYLTEMMAQWLLALLRQAIRYVVCGADCSLHLVLEAIEANAPIPERSSRPSTAQILDGAPYWGFT